MAWKTKSRFGPRNGVKVGSGSGKWYNGCGATYITTYNWTPDLTDIDFETISYEVGIRDRESTKGCIHERKINSWIPFNGSLFSTSQKAVVTNYFQNHYVSFPNPSVTNSPVCDPGFNARAFEAMFPTLEQGLSLTNFLLELTDVKHVLPLFTKWRGISRKIAEGHLMYAFGVRPFLQDVKKLYEVITDHDRIIQNFLERRGTIQKRYYREIDPTIRTDTGWCATAHQHLQTRVVVKETREQHATMTYKFDCPDLDTRALKVKALREMLGLRLTPSVIWEAIPFSFVVDWFFRVQDFLESQEEALIPVTIEVMDYSISCKTTYSYTGDWHMWLTGCGPPWSAVPCYRGSGKTYRRWRALPDTSGDTFINRGQYGLNQLALSASLLRLRF